MGGGGLQPPIYVEFEAPIMEEGLGDKPVGGSEILEPKFIYERVLGIRHLDISKD